MNPIGPRGCYDEAKRFAEALTMAYRNEHKVQTRIVRIFNTYGPRMRINDGRVVPAFISQALKNQPVTVFGRGRQTRSFCYVSDLIEGIYRLMMSDYDLPVNIGNPAEMTVLQFAREIIRATGSRSRIVFKPLPQDDPKQRQPDITRARTILGWQPKVQLTEGLRSTIEYFREQLGAPRRGGGCVNFTPKAWNSRFSGTGTREKSWKITLAPALLEKGRCGNVMCAVCERRVAGVGWWGRGSLAGPGISLG